MNNNGLYIYTRRVKHLNTNKDRKAINVTDEMKRQIRRLTLSYGVAHIFGWNTGAMAFSIARHIRLPPYIATTARKFQSASGPSRSIAATSIDGINDDVSQSSESSEFVPEQSSIWIDTPTPVLDTEPAPTATEPKRRRVRYAGKYPKQYVEKYKELSGDITTIQKVLQKGMTPAGQHIPIMINECMEYLGFGTTTATTIATNISSYEMNRIIPDRDITSHTNQRNILFVDCTLGYGGHSTHALHHLLKLSSQSPTPKHKMVCFDRDPIEIVKATDRLRKVVGEYTDTSDEKEIRMELPDDMITTINSNFCELRSHLEQNRDMGKVTALLADLGLSSMQIADASRGFTYKHDGPLDMRMNINATQQNETAYDLLCRWTVPELARILQDNSDEPYAASIAQAMVGNPDNIPSTTLELANVVRNVVVDQHWSNDHDSTRHRTTKQQIDSTVARVMQAIRIEVNAEFDALEQLLDDLPYMLAPSVGRAVILTFHSGEDRRVKKSFKQGYKDGIYSSWSRDVVRPTSNEKYNNPRSSCCKLRWVVRSDKPMS